MTSFQNWSDPQTWGGTTPQAGEDVVIPTGKTVRLDIDTPSLGIVQIDGVLVFARQDVNLTATGITIKGTLEIGSASSPFTHKAVITLTGSTGSSPTSRGIVVNDGTLALYGDSPDIAWSVLNDHANAGTKKLNLASSVNWKADDRIVIAPTDFFNVTPTEELTISSVSSNIITTIDPLQNTRWGKLQYVTSNGMSLTPEPNLQTPSTNPTVLDERAEIGNLSRSILIQGADDVSWNSDEFGAHVMIMGANSNTWIEGVEFYRVGQAGREGRYPIHFHKLSYGSQGNLIPANGTRVVKDSSIWSSSHRCVTIHATNGVTFENNICYDIGGHAIFFEDAVERKNVIANNLVLKVREPTNRLLESERLNGFRGGSSGLWLTNPDNTVIGNHIADSDGNGFWLSFPNGPLGSSKNVPVIPRHVPLGIFRDNVAHSNFSHNVQFDWAPRPESSNGSVGPLQYQPTIDEQPHSENVRFSLDNIRVWKGRVGIWNRVLGATFNNWVSADNTGTFFQGSGFKGLIKDSLTVGESLNNASQWSDVDPNAPPTAFASYHSLFAIQDNLVVNFPLYPGLDAEGHRGISRQTAHGGMLETRDYYLRPIEIGTVSIRNNLLINSEKGFRTAPGDGSGPHFTLSGALWDPHGELTGATPGNYWVYNNPFLTQGTNCVDVVPVNVIDTLLKQVAPNADPYENGKSCTGPYYGLTGFEGANIDDPNLNSFVSELTVNRYDTNGQEIGRWFVPDGRTGNPMRLHIMRHAALVKGGRYAFNFSNYDSNTQQQIPNIPSEDITFKLDMLMRQQDFVTIAVPFAGSATAKAYVSSYRHSDARPGFAPQTVVDLTPANSLAEVDAGNGDLMWHDKSNNKVWIKVVSPPRFQDSYVPDDTNPPLWTNFNGGTWVRVFSCSYISTSTLPNNDAARSVCP
ncbi:MAG: hypothetical protein K6L75_02580 [Cellvibrionaceae bacterium]